MAAIASGRIGSVSAGYDAPGAGVCSGEAERPRAATGVTQLKFLHFADLHLDAPFAWAPRSTAVLRRANRRRTLERIVELASAERVDALLSGGDLFEHERVEPDTVEFLRRVLGDAGLPVYLAPGNHDWLGPESPYARTRWPGNVHVFTSDRLEAVEPAPGLRLWGAAHCAPANTDSFFAGFRADGSGLNVALAHASERGLLQFEGEGKRPHAPFAAAELAAANLDFAFLGHYHSPRDAERYTYPGNPDPLDFGEEGDRGAVLATFTGARGAPLIERRDVSVSRVADVVVDVSAARDRDEATGLIREALLKADGCVRLTVKGDLAPEVSLDAAAVQRQGEHLDGLLVRLAVSYAYDLERIAAERTVRGQFVRDAVEQVADAELRRRIIVTGLRALDSRSDLEVP